MYFLLIASGFHFQFSGNLFLFFFFLLVFLSFLRQLRQWLRPLQMKSINSGFWLRCNHFFPILFLFFFLFFLFLFFHVLFSILFQLNLLTLCISLDGCLVLLFLFLWTHLLVTLILWFLILFSSLDHRCFLLSLLFRKKSWFCLDFTFFFTLFH